jgi:hypothetical protein
MIVVGHQPQYIPYFGFFNKISKADVFVFVDNIQFNRKSWQQRTLIKSDNSPVYLTIPVSKKGKYDQLINEVEIIDDGWRKKHWKSIQLSYSKTPYFDLYKEGLESFYNNQWQYLSDFTIALTRFLIDAIGIRFARIEIGSELGLSGEKTDLLLDICRKTGCDTYVSGMGAKSYVEEMKFKEANLFHMFNEYAPKQYTQYGHSFLDGMGIIDVMFMYGPKTIDVIKNQI